MPHPLQIPRFTQCCPENFRDRAAKPAATLTSASRPYRAVARKNSRRLSTVLGGNCIANWSNYSTCSLGHDSKSGYNRIAKYQPSFAIRKAEFGGLPYRG